MGETLQYSRIIRAIRETPWAIQPARLADILDVLSFQAQGGKLSHDEIREYIGVNDKRAAARTQRSAGGVAVLSLRGIISHRAEQVDDISGPGGTSVERFRSRFREAMASADVSGLVIDVDSPGGSVEGIPELASEMFEARGKKPVLAVANTLAASAAYWIATAADELSVTPSGEVGSVGVFAAHDDVSEAMEMQGVKRTFISAGKFKTEGNPFEPLSEEARENIQSRVDDVYNEFISALANQRGTSADNVRDKFGQGRTVGAKESVSQGMADRVETLEAGIERMRAGTVKSRNRKRMFRLSMA